MLFDHRNPEHQDRFIAWADKVGLTCWHEAQAVSELLHGRPMESANALLSQFRSMRRSLPWGQFLGWLGAQRAARGIEVDPHWQSAEERAWTRWINQVEG